MSTHARDSGLLTAFSQPCVGCGEPLGGRYGDDRVCWECFQRRNGDASGGDENSGSSRAKRRAVLTAASKIRAERVRWLWKGRVPRRAVVVVAGEKGLGKSTLTNACLVARLTRGELEGEFHGQPMDVAVATAEDDWRSVVKPRLMAHEADLERVHCLNMTDDAGDSMLTLPDDVAAVEAGLADLEATTGRTVGALVIDPSDLLAWRMRSGRPDDNAPVIPAANGDAWTDAAYRSWRRKAFKRALTAAGIEHARPYDLRHSFASLLLHEGRSVVYVARQLGHGAQFTLSTYGHAIDELDDRPQQDAEDAILGARSPAPAHTLPIAHE